MNDLMWIAHDLADHGLVVGEDYEHDRIGIARPASLEGTKFKGWAENRIVGFWGGMVKSNAPSATLKTVGSGRKTMYHLNVSIGAAPGPGPEWIDETYKTREEAVDAVVGCFFGDKIDFNNPSLPERYSINC